MCGVVGADPLGNQRKRSKGAHSPLRELGAGPVGGEGGRGEEPYKRREWLVLPGESGFSKAGWDPDPDSPAPEGI